MVERQDWWPEDAGTLAQAHAMRASELVAWVEEIDQENRTSGHPGVQPETRVILDARQDYRIRLAAAHAATAQALHHSGLASVAS